MLFSTEHISVRKMNNDIKDISFLLEWLTNSAVVELAYSEGAPWDMEKVKAKFGKKTIAASLTIPCFILYNEKEIGYTQFYPVEEDSYLFNADVPFSEFAGGYGMDIFIGYPHLWGKEIGTKTVRAMADYLMNTHGAKVICADPEENNQRSVRCWIKAGFSPMGKIRNWDYPDKTSILMAIRG
ncbi:MAG: acetyltransferase [Oscillospiraceae bacterium]|nr:acetyltransferase [Oscillospiraceae bacterium]